MHDDIPAPPGKSNNPVGPDLLARISILSASDLTTRMSYTLRLKILHLPDYPDPMFEP